jgi:hypothetical protein
MDKEKLSYEFEVIKILRLYKDKFSQVGLNIDTNYLDYFGNQCPRCKSEMKVYRNTVKGVGSISSFMLLEQNKAVLYPLCKSCVRKLSSGYSDPAEDKKVEEFICSKLPELKRRILSEDEKAEEIKKEYEIIEKLKKIE